MWDYEWMFREPLWIDWYDTMGEWQIPHVIAAPASAEDHSRPKGKPRPRLGYTT